MTSTIWENGFPEGAGTPNSTWSWETTMIPPMPQENPETTAWGTFDTWRPRRRTQNTIMKMDATIQTLAAPPIPCCLTAEKMKGDGGTGGASDKNWISTEERGDGSGDDGG